MAETDKPLLAHLFRRAGFGATFQELRHYSQIGYEAAVDEWLHPEQQPPIEEEVTVVAGSIMERGGISRRLFVTQSRPSDKLRSRYNKPSMEQLTRVVNSGNEPVHRQSVGT